VARASEQASEAESGEPGRVFLATLIALTFSMNLLARGVPETFAVFLLPVQSGLGVSRADITLTYSVYMLTSGLSGPFAGQLIDRFGARLTYGLGLACLGCGYLLAGFADGLWQYLLAVGLLGGIGASLLGMIVASALLSRWFATRIGSIMSLPYAAIGIGILVLPPLTQLLLASYDWRLTHQLLGGAVLLLLPLVALLPLGRMTAGSPRWRALRREGSAGVAPWRLGVVLRTSAFWGLFTAYMSTAVAAFSVMPHSVAYLIEQGFHPLFAASAFGLAGMLSAIGIVAMGWLSDRVGRRQAATFSYALTVIGIVALSLVSLWPTLALVYAFVFCFGLMQGARGPVFVAMVAVLFPGGVGSVYGALSLAQGLGAGLGSWVSGLLYELTGSYIASFALAICGALVGLSMFWMVGSLREEKAASAPPTLRAT
jgi:MFS family permease